MQRVKNYASPRVSSLACSLLYEHCAIRRENISLYRRSRSRSSVYLQPATSSIISLLLERPSYVRTRRSVRRSRLCSTNNNHDTRYPYRYLERPRQNITEYCTTPTTTARTGTIEVSWTTNCDSRKHEGRRPDIGTRNNQGSEHNSNNRPILGWRLQYCLLLIFYYSTVPQLKMFIQDRIVGGKDEDRGDRGQYAQVAVDEDVAAPKVSRSDPESSSRGRRCCCCCFCTLVFLLCLGGAAFAAFYFGYLDPDSLTAIFHKQEQADVAPGNPPVAIPTTTGGGVPIGPSGGRPPISSRPAMPSAGVPRTPTQSRSAPPNLQSPSVPATHVPRPPVRAPTLPPKTMGGNPSAPVGTPTTTYMPPSRAAPTRMAPPTYPPSRPATSTGGMTTTPPYEPSSLYSGGSMSGSRPPTVSMSGSSSASIPGSGSGSMSEPSAGSMSGSSSGVMPGSSSGTMTSPGGLKTFISEYSPSSDLDTPSSPAYKALQWMTTSDQFTNSGGSFSAQTIQRFVLATLYFSLNGPDWNSGISSASSEWNLRSSEYQGNHVCNWANVLCSGPVSSNSNTPTTSVITGVTLDQVFSDDSSHRVSRLPAEIGLLSSLTSFQVTRNNVVGSIPTQIGALTQLTKLDLSNNALLGSIPSSLSSLTRLATLRLFNNQLTGNTQSLARISALSGLALYGNPNLSGQMTASACFSHGGLPPKVLVDCDPGPTAQCICCEEPVPSSPGMPCLDPASCSSRKCLP